MQLPGVMHSYLVFSMFLFRNRFAYIYSCHFHAFILTLCRHMPSLLVTLEMHSLSLVVEIMYWYVEIFSCVHQYLFGPFRWNFSVGHHELSYSEAAIPYTAGAEEKCDSSTCDSGIL